MNKYSIFGEKNNVLVSKNFISKAFVNNCLRVASALSIAAAFSSEAFSATLAADNLDNTTSPFSYRVNPIESDPVNFPALTVTGATAGPLNYYFGTKGTATSGVTANQGSVEFVTGSITGATAATPGTFTYTPAVGFHGADTFTFHMNGSGVNSNAYTVTVLVGNPLEVETDNQQVPFAVAPVANTLSNFVATGGVAPYTYSVTVNPLHGSLSATNSATPTYTPDDLFYGTDSFTYTIKDSATPPAMRSGLFVVNVVGQGIRTTPEEDISVTGQITGTRPLIVDGGGEVGLNNTQATAQNSNSGGVFVKDGSVLRLRNDQQLTTANAVRLQGFIAGATDTVIANQLNLV